MIRNRKQTERGVSTVVSHVLTIGITSILIIGLLFGATSYLDDQRSTAANQELETIGNRIANELSQLDQVTQRGGNATITSSHAEKIAGSEYNARIRTGQECDSPQFDSDQCLIISSNELEITHKIPLKNESNLEITRLANGEFRLQSTSGSSGGTNINRLNESKVYELSMRPGVGQDVKREGGRVLDPTNRPPVPKFTFEPGSPDSSRPINFNAKASKDPDGSIVEYAWKFNDSATSYVKTSTPLYSFSYDGEPGKKNVSLRVTDNDGAEVYVNKSITVSGLEYVRGSLETYNSNDDALTFKMKNNWSSRDVKIDEFLVNPPDSVTQFSGTVTIDSPTDSETLSGSTPIPDGGEIIGISNVTVGPNEEVTITMDSFVQNVDNDEVRFGVRHYVQNAGNPEFGRTNATLFSDVVGGFSISRMDVTNSGQDVDLVIESSDQLGTMDVSLSGDVSGSLSKSDFNETDIFGGPWRYETDISNNTDGTFKATLNTAEDTAATPSGQVPLSDQVSVIQDGYTWTTASHWDTANSEYAVVHDSFGDHDAGVLELGYPSEDRGSGNLLVYYPFDDPSGGIAEDASPTNNDGIIQGAAQDAGVFGTDALDFDGNEDYVEDNGAGYLNGHNEITISAWIESDYISTNRGVMIGEDPVGDDKSIGFRYDYSGWLGGCSDCIKTGLSVSGDSTQYESSSNTQTTDWQHVVITWSNGERMKMYLDGSPEPYTGKDDETGTTSGINRLLVGQGSKDTGSFDGWNGRIDEVRIYDRELNASEARELYDVTQQGNLTTAKQTGSTIQSSDLYVWYNISKHPGDKVEVKVHSDRPTPPEESDWVELGDGTGDRKITGFSEDTQDFWIETRITTNSVERSPEINTLKVCDKGSTCSAP